MNVPLKVLTVFRNDSMAFCFIHLHLHVIPKGRVLNRITALCTENSCNSAFPYKAPAAVRERIYRLSYIYIQPVCSFCPAKNGAILYALLEILTG